MLFETSCDSAGIEISDDVYILTPEEARKHIEPPKLEKLIASPSNAQVKPGAKQAFAVEGLDQFGNGISAGDVSWTATGGTIDDHGVFEAGADEGSFLVTAASAGKAATATVRID